MILSGSQKLLDHYQNFLVVVQGYSLFDYLSFASLIETAIARGMPWVELFVGIFLVLGLWVKLSLKTAMLLFLGFVCILSQAIIRDLPIKECGCFGEKFSLPIHVMLMLDAATLILILFSLKNFEQTRQWSLDRYLE